MSQQINLFESGLVKSKDWFTLSFVAGIYVLAAIAMVYLYTGIESENAQLLAQRNQTVSQYDTMQKKVDEFAKKAIPVDNSKLEAELKKLNTRFEMQSQMLAIFQQSISENAYHLIDYMRGFASKSLSGVWLTGFKIEPAAQHVSLSGQALQTEDIPLYLDLLSAQPVFEGTQFSGLQFKQVELQKQLAPQASATTAPAQAAVVAPTASPEATGKGASAPAVAANAAMPSSSTASASATSAPVTDETTKLKVYAFDVKGQDVRDKTKSVSAISWDDFVSQTAPQPQAKQP
ncbi:MAG TPA: PilN domain-containing protein [Methylophilus sp.]|uniref:PilN domain-containing protein n=1 Tax=Methylophilus sp. TaxID=29541 RepID=UPI002BFB55D7|nr:PilN domain-containing protein [Methylophilus sp.]HSH88281.1 PilN domain-containing protein [Methylophilus sp.]